MTATTGFLLAAALLLIAALAILLPPLLRKPREATDVDRRQANLDICRDQLAELQREHDEGSLSEADFEQARNELQRRLLDEAQPEAAPTQSGGSRKTALALIIALPLAAATVYALQGNPRALDPAQHRAAMQAQEIDALLDKLAARLKANPDDPKGWIMLARSYKALGRLRESAEAYSHGGDVLDKDPALLADYAEVLAQLNNGKLEGQPMQLIDRALKIDPDEPQALFLAGAAAIDRKDFATVVKHWERLLPQLQPDSDEARSLSEAVNKARQALGGKLDSAGGKDKQPAAANAISGEVSLSSALTAQANPDDPVFIFARAGEGSRMPLAVIRTRVGELPLRFTLDDSLALPGGQKISAFKTVTVEARIAKSGMAQVAKGDLYGVRDNVKPGSKNLKLQIDRVQP